jgi:hypothetical protein
MGQILNGCATTTEAVRRAIQNSQESLRGLAKRYGNQADFTNAYNYARPLKTLKGLTPYEYICKCWISQPERFRLNPLQKMPGLNN